MSFRPGPGGQQAEVPMWALENLKLWIRGDYSPGSHPSMLSVLRSYGAYHGVRLVTEITSNDLAGWKTSRMRSRAAGATIAREVSVLRELFEGWSRRA